MQSLGSAMDLRLKRLLSASWSSKFLRRKQFVSHREVCCLQVLSASMAFTFTKPFLLDILMLSAFLRAVLFPSLLHLRFSIRVLAV